MLEKLHKILYRPPPLRGGFQISIFTMSCTGNLMINISDSLGHTCLSIPLNWSILFSVYFWSHKTCQKLILKNYEQIFLFRVFSVWPYILEPFPIVFSDEKHCDLFQVLQTRRRASNSLSSRCETFLRRNIMLKNPDYFVGDIASYTMSESYKFRT